MLLGEGAKLVPYWSRSYPHELTQQHYYGRAHSGSPQPSALRCNHPIGGCRSRCMEAELTYEHSG